MSEDDISSPDYVPATSALANGDCFDARFFGYTKREAEIMDPQHRIFLECAWAALEDAGYDGGVRRSIGVFGGVAPNTYLPNVLMTRPDIMDIMGDYAMLIGSEREYAITRVEYKLNLKGPAVSIATACSTSGSRCMSPIRACSAEKPKWHSSVVDASVCHSAPAIGTNPTVSCHLMVVAARLMRMPLERSAVVGWPSL